MMAPLLAAAAGAVVGSVLGFLGALYIERRREAATARAEILAIALEMSLLEDTIASAVEQGMRLRDELRRDLWDRYSTRLINWVPWHLVSALHAHHQSFSTVKAIYERLCTPPLVEGDELKNMHMRLWAFVHWSQCLRAELRDSVKPMERSFWPRYCPGAGPSEKEQQTLVRLTDKLNDGALEFVRSKGLEPTVQVPIRITSVS